MDWKRDSGIGRAGVTALCCVFVALVWVAVHLLAYASFPPLRDMEAVGGGILALWFFGEWVDKGEDEDRKMREAIDLLEGKLDTVLKNQSEILRKL